jgi:hypothetical protein
VKVGSGQKRLVPVDLFGEVFDLYGRHARGIHGGDDAAHAGAGDAVDRDVMLVEPLKHADFGEAKRASAGDRKTDARAMGWLGLRRRWSWFRGQLLG